VVSRLLAPSVVVLRIRGVQEFSLDLAMAWVDQACGGSFDTGSPASNQPASNYAQRSTAAALLSSGNGPALHITQRCS
jgi:hypothetical protein